MQGKVVDVERWLQLWIDETALGEAVERHLPTDADYQRWVQYPEEVETELSDEIQTRETVQDALETVKLSGLVPPIQFETGVAQIPETTVESLGAILARMQDRINVRLHLIGHADNRPLSPRLEAIYGDNAGLSRERAGQVAEHFQTSLALPPEAHAIKRRPTASVPSIPRVRIARNASRGIQPNCERRPTRTAFGRRSARE